MGVLILNRGLPLNNPPNINLQKHPKTSKTIYAFVDIIDTSN